MAIDQLRRGVASAQLMTRLAAEHGLAAEVCLQGTHISVAALADPTTEITRDQELQLVRNLVRELGHIPGLGLEAGCRYHLPISGVFGLAAASSTTYRGAAKLSGKFHDLSDAFVRFHLERSGERYRVRIDDSGIPADLRSFLVERDFAGFITMSREVRSGGLPLIGAEFRFPRPAHADRFRQICGLEPRFGAALNALWLDAAVLDIPLIQGDDLLARMLEDQCRRLLARRQMRGGVAGKVRDVLLQARDEVPDLGHVAASLCLSARSLRRRLEDEGTSFRALVSEVRQAVAEEMLSSTRMKLEEIAVRLGYSEPSSFITAFKRWTGVSPDTFRRQYRERIAAD